LFKANRFLRRADHAIQTAALGQLRQLRGVVGWIA